jgi:alkanesulfonate monooxygenase SsuD/methylene tetrahydromethanopterin reductase-like flavin-dependent oxidoreductase (luciferase family)
VGEAQLLFTSLEQAFVNLRTGRPGQLPPPYPRYAETLEPRIADMLERVLRCAIVGGPAEIKAGLDHFIAAHGPDEIMVTAQIYDAVARRRSYELLAQIHPPQGLSPSG